MKFFKLLFSIVLGYFAYTKYFPKDISSPIAEKAYNASNGLRGAVFEIPIPSPAMVTEIIEGFSVGGSAKTHSYIWFVKPEGSAKETVAYYDKKFASLEKKKKAYKTVYSKNSVNWSV